MTWIDGRAGRLWFEAVGAGAPTSIWVHGLTGSLHDLHSIAARTPGTRVLMDLRGHGRSDAPERGYDVRGYREDVELVAEHVGATRAFGISSGAGAICDLLADAPDRFERVALLIPAAGGVSDEDAAGLRALADALGSVPLDALADLQALADAPLYRARPYWRALIHERTLHMNPIGVARAIRAYVDAPPSPPDVEALTKVIAPTLIVAHEGDPVHPASTARVLADAFPNAEARIYPEPLAMYDDVDAFAALLGAHLGA
jgi:3-oxoadipate enol-lactonase